MEYKDKEKVKTESIIGLKYIEYMPYKKFS